MGRIVYLNGQFVPYDRAKIPISSHVLHYGTGCFEGIRGYWNEEKKKLFVFRLKDHLERLGRSCHTLAMKLPAETDVLCQIVVELLKKNRHRENVYIRPLVYKCDETVTKFNLDKLADGFAIFTQPLGHHLDVSHGIKVMVSSWQRVGSKMIPPAAKPTGLYLNTCLAKTEVQRKGFDEAILLNSNGTVAEGSAENIFLVEHGRLVTPSVDQNILVGITRDTIIEIAKKEFGIKTIERPIVRQELFSADEVFLTGTGAEVTPVIQIDRTKIGNGKIGETTKKIQDLYFQIVTGQNKKYAKWLTVV